MRNIFRALFEASLDAIVLLDTSRRYRDANPAACGLFECSLPELRQRKIDDFTDAPEWPDFKRLWEAFLEHGEQEGEFELRLSSGAHRLVWYRAKAHVTRGLHLSVLRDITERRALEQKLASRARELADTNRRKDEFFAILAHELRSPLSPIVTALYLMDRPGTRPDAIKRYCDLIERQVERLGRLVDDLLDVSRIGRGQIELRKQHVKISYIVERAAETVRPLIDGKEQHLQLSLPDGLWLSADPVRIEQVVINLLHNASKYSNVGGNITVSAARENESVVLRVCDDGIGIAPDMMPVIFDMFTQAHRAAGRAEGGLGIGLTLVRSLVELHDGAVEAASRGEGLGSEFTVRLPAAPGPRGELNLEAQQRLGRPLTILVVDDNKEARETLCELLFSFGHRVHAAHDANEAISVLGDAAPDLALLDLDLPGRWSGYELCRELRHRPRMERAMIVALSSRVRSRDRARSRVAGFDAHLGKPIDPNELKQALSEAVARQSTSPTDPVPNLA